MSRLFYHTMQDNAGNLLFGVSGTMRLAGSGTLATIYGDEALTVILPNPMTNHPSYGSFKCFLGAGDYDFYMAKSGYTFETLTGVQGHGTMAQQDAGAVAITGGTVDGLTSLRTATLGVNTAPETAAALVISHSKLAAQHGMIFRPFGGDSGAVEIVFLNNAAAQVGSILTTTTATTYGTTSDVRLKYAIAPLTGALDVVQALRPVHFLWKSDDTPGRGFVADEVQAVIPEGVITGERDAVAADGSIQPQMIDHSKLVVYLVGACKELAAQVAALTARLEACGG